MMRQVQVSVKIQAKTKRRRLRKNGSLDPETAIRVMQTVLSWMTYSTNWVGLKWGTTVKRRKWRISIQYL
jgi:hypothetical protein